MAAMMVGGFDLNDISGNKRADLGWSFGGGVSRFADGSDIHFL